MKWLLPLLIGASLHAAFFESGFTPTRQGYMKYFSVFREIQYELFRKSAYTMFDFYQFGVISFYRDMLSRDDIDMEAVLAWQERTVQFAVYTNYAAAVTILKQDGTKRRVASRLIGTGSGVLISDSIVFTAGHNITVIDRITPSDGISYVAMHGAEAYRARLLQYEFRSTGTVTNRGFTNYASLMNAYSNLGDWAFLAVDKPMSLPTLAVAEPELGMKVVFMGFPRGEIGLSTNFLVENFHADTNSEARLGRTALPIPFAGVIEKINRYGRHTIRITAGSEGMAGISGGPVFSLNGALLGIIVTGGKDPDELETTQSFFSVREAIRRYQAAGGTMRIAAD